MTEIITGNTPSGENPTDFPEPISQRKAVGSRPNELLAVLRGKLQSAEVMLLDPVPGRIQHAEFLIAEAAECMQALAKNCADVSTEESMLWPEAPGLERTFRRVRALLQGALRIQWHRMRRTGLYIETYTSGGKAKVCLHPTSRLDIEI